MTQAPTLDHPTLGHPLHGEFLALFGAAKRDAGLPDTPSGPPQFGGKPSATRAVEKIKVDQVLVRKAGVVGQRGHDVSCPYPVTSRNTTMRTPR